MKYKDLQCGDSIKLTNDLLIYKTNKVIFPKGTICIIDSMDCGKDKLDEYFVLDKNKKEHLIMRDDCIPWKKG